MCHDREKLHKDMGHDPRSGGIKQCRGGVLCNDRGGDRGKGCIKYNERNGICSERGYKIVHRQQRSEELRIEEGFRKDATSRDQRFVAAERGGIRNSGVVLKIDGPKNPADLMTKYLKSQEIKDRLETMGIRIRWKKWSDHEEVLE